GPLDRIAARLKATMRPRHRAGMFGISILNLKIRPDSEDKQSLTHLSAPTLATVHFGQTAGDFCSRVFRSHNSQALGNSDSCCFGVSDTPFAERSRFVDLPY